MGRQEQIAQFLAEEPDWQLVGGSLSGPTVLEGPAVVLGPTDKEYRFHLRMDVPLLFPQPDAHPEVTVVASPFPGLDRDAHVDATTGRLCVQMPPAHEIDYESGGLAGFFQQVLIHLRRVVIFALIGQYPGPAYAHAADGQQQFRTELQAGFPLSLRRFVQPGLALPPDNQWCPCGAHRRFGECHKSSLKAARTAFLAAGGKPREFRRFRIR